MEICHCLKGKTILKSFLEYNWDQKEPLLDSFLDTDGEILNSDAKEARNVNNSLCPIFGMRQEHAYKRQILRGLNIHQLGQKRGEKKKKRGKT